MGTLYSTRRMITPSIVPSLPTSTSRSSGLPTKVRFIFLNTYVVLFFFFLFIFFITSLIYLLITGLLGDVVTLSHTCQCLVQRNFIVPPPHPYFYFARLVDAQFPQITTTEIESLSSSRTFDGYFFDDLGFHFCFSKCLPFRRRLFANERRWVLLLETSLITVGLQAYIFEVDEVAKKINSCRRSEGVSTADECR